MVASSGVLPAQKYSRNDVASKVAEDTMTLRDGRFRRILHHVRYEKSLQHGHLLLQKTEYQVGIYAALMCLINLDVAELG